MIGFWQVWGKSIHWQRVNPAW